MKEKGAKQFRLEAEACRRLAEQAFSPVDKEAWLALAEDWMKLAEDAERWRDWPRRSVDRKAP